VDDYAFPIIVFILFILWGLVEFAIHHQKFLSVAGAIVMVILFLGLGLYVVKYMGRTLHIHKIKNASIVSVIVGFYGL
jgi:hypothetical protein